MQNITFEKSFEDVKKLVNDFQSNLQFYTSKEYSEAQVRKDFIDKFFIALGWDVNHEHQKNPYEQEVKIERTMQIGDNPKYADYAFCLKPDFRSPRFLVEAKKPSHNLYNADYYFQSIRYAWNNQTPLVILTDFEEFHIIDSRYKPDIDTALQRKITLYRFTDYADEEKFRHIFHLFSREEVSNDSIYKYSDTLAKPKGKGFQKTLFDATGIQQLDETFLNDLDEFRKTLATSFKRSNPALNSYELTEAVQRTLDRLIFIRFLEDKLIENEHYVSEFGDKTTAWQDFINVSKKLDSKYNGIVFKEHLIDGKSKNFYPPNDTEFATICDELSHKNSPYLFNQIPVHILGSIYERFLGKVVVPKGRGIAIEEKPEVRKAGGVYYTPQYIVEYIVNNTVGKLIEGKTPKEISKLRFADIACGSGSFLITVFDTLLKYHGKYYNENTAEAKKDGCILIYTNKEYSLTDKIYVLSIPQKREILVNNIYGVDIDSQAVEVTQLSLFLKLLEDETPATASDTWNMFQKKVALLPSLDKNIICGNSLIGSDIYEGKLFSSDEERKINPMDFEVSFSKVMRNGGFDCIIGNPPYGGELMDEEYLEQRYNYSSKMKEVNTYVYFLEKSKNILKKSGMLGYIIPDTLLLKIQYNSIRSFLYKEVSVTQILETGTVFEQAKATPNIIIFFVNIIPNKNFEISRLQVNPAQKITSILSDIANNNWSNHGILSYKEWGNFFGLQLGKYVDKKRQKIISKIVDNKLNNLLKEIDGIHIDRGMEGGKDSLSKEFKNGLNKIIIPENINQYYITNKPELFVKDYKDSFKFERVVIIRIRNTKIKTRLITAFLEKDIATLKTVQQIYFTKNHTKYLKFIVGLLNSKLLNFYCSHFLVDDINKDYIGNFPIPKKIDNSLVEQFAQKVEFISKCKSEIENMKSDYDKSFQEKKIASFVTQIDQLVYKLYDLTPEEIKIVEGE